MVVTTKEEFLELLSEGNIGETIEVDLKDIDLSNITFEEDTKITGTFTNVSFENSTFMFSNISNTTFHNCNLKNVNFEECNLNNVKFLDGTSLEYSIFFDVDVSGITIDDSVKLSNTDLRGASNANSIINTDGTKIPIKNLLDRGVIVQDSVRQQAEESEPAPAPAPAEVNPLLPENMISGEEFESLMENIADELFESDVDWLQDILTEIYAGVIEKQNDNGDVFKNIIDEQLNSTEWNNRSLRRVANEKIETAVHHIIINSIINNINSLTFGEDNPALSLLPYVKSKLNKFLTKDVIKKIIISVNGAPSQAQAPAQAPARSQASSAPAPAPAQVSSEVNPFLLENIMSQPEISDTVNRIGREVAGGDIEWAEQYIGDIFINILKEKNNAGEMFISFISRVLGITAYEFSSSQVSPLIRKLRQALLTIIINDIKTHADDSELMSIVSRVKKILNKFLNRDAILKLKESVERQQATQEEAQQAEEEQIKLPRVKASLNVKVEFTDPITQDKFNGTIEEYIDEDENNIVIVFQKKKEGKLVDQYFLTNRDFIKAAYGGNENTVYPCKQESLALKPREENIVNVPYFDLHKLGFVETNQQYCNMEQYDKNENNQLFAIVDLKKEYPSFVSHYVRYDPEPNVVSEQHCQAGQEGKVCKMIVATPSTKDDPNGDLQYGGSKSKKSNKTKKRKGNKKKRTIKKKANKKRKGKKTQRRR